MHDQMKPKKKSPYVSLCKPDPRRRQLEIYININGSPNLGKNAINKDISPRASVSVHDITWAIFGLDDYARNDTEGTDAAGFDKSRESLVECTTICE
jgi:hypothetical protein